MTTPAGRPPRMTSSAARSVREQAERLVHGRADVERRQRPVHHLAHGPAHHVRVAIGAVEQALLAHRADDPGEVAVAGGLGDRQLADAVLLEQVDGGPDQVGRPGEDHVRDRLAVVAGVEQLADPGHGARRRQQAVRPHPLVVVELREVVAAAVGEDHDQHRIGRRRGLLAHQPGGLVERGQHRRPARLAGQDPLLAGDPARHREGVAVRHAHPAIDHGRVVGAGEEVLAHALGEVRPRGVARQHAALRVRADHPQRRASAL